MDHKAREYARKIETRIMQAAIAELLKAGYWLSVFDGEEITVSKSTEAAKVFDAMRTTDEDRILVYAVNDMFASGYRLVGSVLFVYGNDGHDVIADYSDVPAIADALEPVHAMADAIMERDTQTDSENIFGLPSIAQSIAKDRR